MNPHYPLVSQRAANRCEYCHAPEAVFNFPFEVEHVIPRSRQGPDDASNLALACRACNLRKADHLTGEDETTRSAVRLFHPRHDRWNEQMNSPVQMTARRQWMRLNLFP
jgi:5-methylcytosine-specific restriction endonuclease McrA